MSQASEDSELQNSFIHVTSVDLEPRVEDTSFILLFGCTGTGKTSFANIASKSEMEVGKGLHSSTKQLESSKTFQLDGQPVVVVDCPGFNDTYLTETEILRRLAEFLVEAYEKKHKIVGLLYFHKISDTRVGGASFRHMNMFKALCGSSAFENVVYVTNMWSEPLTDDEALREEELQNTSEFFGDPLTLGAQIARHNNTPESAHNIIRKILGRGQVATNLQRQLVDAKIPLEETDVGLVIGKDLEDDLRKQQEEMNELKVEKEKASGANNQKWLQRLETQEERARTKEQQLLAQLHDLKANKPKQLDTPSLQIRAVQERVINSGLSTFQEQLEATMNKLTRFEKHSDAQFNAYPSKQKEWNRQRDEETALEVKKITNGMVAHSRRRVVDRGTLGNIAGIACGFLAPGNIISRIGTVFSLLSDTNRQNSPMTVGESHLARTISNPNRQSYGVSSSRPTDMYDRRLNIPGTAHQQAQISEGSQIYRFYGNGNAYHEVHGRTAIPRKQRQGSQEAKKLEPLVGGIHAPTSEHR